MKILGIGQTKFGELYEKSLEDLLIEVVNLALSDASININELDAVVIANMFAGESAGYSHLGAIFAGIFGVNIPVIRVEAACASGGVAIYNALNLLKAGAAKKILVLGIEKMTDHSTENVTKYLMQAADNAERQAGFSFPALYALMASSYMNEYGLTRDELSMVSELMHKNALTNENAQFKKTYSIDEINNSNLVADPLRLLDCSPISDGAAAIIISNEKGGIELTDAEMATDSAGLSNRDTITSIKSAKIAASKLFSNNQLSPEQIDILEVHDCFSIALLIALEDLGFAKPGQAKLIVKSIAKNDSSLLLNSSGGLKACGHPVGATGVKQIVEIVKQMRTNPKIKNGIAHNIGGTGGTAVISLIQNHV